MKLILQNWDKYRILWNTIKANKFWGAEKLDLMMRLSFIIFYLDYNKVDILLIYLSKQLNIVTV